VIIITLSVIKYERIYIFIIYMCDYPTLGVIIRDE